MRDVLATKGTPARTFPYHVNPKDLKRSYELRLAAQFGDSKAKERLRAYNKRQKEKRVEAGRSEWKVDGHSFNRYKMMNYIVARTANGELLSEICDQDEMPSVMEVYKWFENHPDFEREFRIAEMARGHRLGDEVERIARNTDRENVSADKLKTEVLGKAAARLNARFQDKQVVQQQDEYSHMTRDQINERIKRMIEANPDLLAALPEEMRSSLEMKEPPPEPELPILGHEGTDSADVVDVEPIDPEEHPQE